MRMGYRFPAVIVLAMSCAAFGRAQDDPGERKPAVYLRSPDERLARLASILSLGQRRENKARRILAGVDADVRRAIAAGNAKLRLLLSGEELEIFDGMRDDTEGAPTSSQPTRHLTPSSGLDKGSGGRGSKGGRGSDTGRGSGGHGGMSGGGGRGAGGGSGAQTPEGGAAQGRGAHGYCGDGICDQFEKTRGICPKDCGQSSEPPAQE